MHSCSKGPRVSGKLSEKLKTGKGLVKFRIDDKTDTKTRIFREIPELE